VHCDAWQRLLRLVDSQLEGIVTQNRMIVGPEIIVEYSSVLRYTRYLYHIDSHSCLVFSAAAVYRIFICYLIYRYAYT
jgi:hypothetical protein